MAKQQRKSSKYTTLSTNIGTAIDLNASTIASIQNAHQDNTSSNIVSKQSNKSNLIIETDSVTNKSAFDTLILLESYTVQNKPGYIFTEFILQDVEKYFKLNGEFVHVQYNVMFLACISTDELDSTDVSISMSPILIEYSSTIDFHIVLDSIQLYIDDDEMLYDDIKDTPLFKLILEDLETEWSSMIGARIKMFFDTNQSKVF